MVSPSHGTKPSAPRARISTNGIGGPCCARLSYAAAPVRPRSCPGAPEIVPIGHISVMPQPCVMWRPWRSPKASIIARGGAEPPTVIVRIAREVPAVRGWRRAPAGSPSRSSARPALTVTCSSSKASSRLWGSRCGPGKTCFAPTRRAAEREAPRVGVEHRHDGKDGVALVDAEQRARRERVDRDRAVRVDDALRQAGGAAREAHRGGGALVDVAVRERALVRGGEELLVVDRARRACRPRPRRSRARTRPGRRTARRAATAPCPRRARGRRRARRCTCCRRDGAGG